MPISEQERRRLQRLFRDYRRSGDPAVRDQLVVGHMRLATHLALRFTNRGVPTDDLVQVASLGLLRAIERFDPDRGLEFSTFATPTIVGELKRHFRDKGWAIRVPRRIQELHLNLNHQVAELTQQLGRSPSIPELAAATRVSEEEVLEAMEAAQAYQTTPLDRLGRPSADGGDRGDAEIGDLDVALLRSEDQMVVDRLLATLPRREQLLVRLRFFEDMTQSEIAERLGISQMHVSRLLSRSLGQLRSLLAAE